MTTYRPLSRDEEVACAERWLQHGDKAALEALVRSCLPLVVRIVTREFRNAGPPVEDLIQEGNVGLVIAARRFDPAHNARLATYAVWWIRMCILSHILRTFGPYNVARTRDGQILFYHLKRVRRQLESEGVAPTPEAIAARLNVNADAVVEMSIRMANRDVVLGARSSEDGAPIDLADAAPSPEEVLATKHEWVAQRRLVAAGIASLTPRQQEVVRALYLEPQRPTLKSVGARFGLSRERIRQIEALALARLRKHCAKTERGAELFEPRT